MTLENDRKSRSDAYTDLPKQFSPLSSREVDVDIVVLSANRFLYKRLFHDSAIDNYSVSVLA